MKYYSAQEDTLLIKNFPANGTKYCSELLNRTYSSVRFRAKKLNLKIEKPSLSKIMKSAAMLRWEKHPKLEGYAVEVSDITNYGPEVCYFLGYFWADGSFSGKHAIHLEIQKNDGDDIKDTMFEIGGWNIQTRQRTRAGKLFGKVQMKFVASNKFLVEHLKRFGFSNKSIDSPEKILEAIPLGLRRYFWRGYFDGDGCVYFSKNFRTKSMNFWGSTGQDWSSLINVYDSLGLKYYVKKYKRTSKSGKVYKSSTVYVTNGVDIVKFLDFIYLDRENDKIGLTRKYNKYLEIKSYVERL